MNDGAYTFFRKPEMARGRDSVLRMPLPHTQRFGRFVARKRPGLLRECFACGVVKVGLGLKKEKKAQKNCLFFAVME